MDRAGRPIGRPHHSAKVTLPDSGCTPAPAPCSVGDT